MPSVELAIDSRRMPYSTLFTRWMKAPEHLYYFLLLSTHPSYAGDAEAWRSWIRMGFSVSLMDGPPAARAHKVVNTTYHTPRRIEMTLESADSSTLAKLERLLRSIDSLRVPVAPLDEAARGERLLNDAEIDKQIGAPLRQAMGACGLLETEKTALLEPVKRAVSALASDYIVSMEIKGQRQAAASPSR